MHQPPATHVLLRRVMFTAAGAVAGLVLATFVLTRLDFPRVPIFVLGAVGLAAAVIDVCCFQPGEQHRTKASAAWVVGFAVLVALLVLAMLVPYGVVILVGRALGMWDGWQLWLEARPMALGVIGGVLGLAIGHFADDYA